MQVKTDGLIIRVTNVGESDRIATILTRKCGVIRASARGARRLKSRMSTSSRLLCYSDFTLFGGREKYIINEAEPLEFFMEVNGDLLKLALAQYFAELSGFLAPKEEPAEIYLRLALNALHLLGEGKKQAALLKAAFEMRILTLSGYMPDIVACRECGTYESPVMYFDPLAGNLLCSHCAADHPHNGYIALSSGALLALRHTVYVDFERLFSFTLTQDPLHEMSAAAEQYTLCMLERTFPTLDFYKRLLPQ